MDYRLTPQRYRQVLGRAQAAPARQTQLTPTTMFATLQVTKFCLWLKWTGSQGKVSMRGVRTQFTFCTCSSSSISALRGLQRCEWKARPGGVRTAMVEANIGAVLLVGWGFTWSYWLTHSFPQTWSIAAQNNNLKSTIYRKPPISNDRQWPTRLETMELRTNLSACGSRANPSGGQRRERKVTDGVWGREIRQPI